MRFIELSPALEISEPRDPPKGALALGCGVLLSSILFAAWTPGVAAQTHARDDPKFYEVFGKRYQVRASSNGYHERGVASWYGRPFHGRPTSSGEMYDMNDMTAAHTTLPLPTWVEVTNLSNGKRIVVKVNDRGPFVGDRVIDLSYAAANALDIVRSGTARVEIRAVSEPRETTSSGSSARAPALSSAAAHVESAKPVAPPAPPTPPPVSTATAALQPTPSVAPAGRLFAEAGKYRTRGDAVAVVEELRAQGLVNAFVVTEDGRRKSVHRVRVGPLIDGSDVERMSDRLRGLGAKRSRSVVMH